VNEGTEISKAIGGKPDMPRRRANTQELINEVKEVIPRCLTRDQREKVFLDPEPPVWCIGMGKWRYQAQIWKDGLKLKRANASPPLPDTPEWEPWIASQGAGGITRDPSTFEEV
jgi:hypothetical protein